MPPRSQRSSSAAVCPADWTERADRLESEPATDEFANTKAFSGFAVDDVQKARQFYIAWFKDPAGNVLSVPQER
jgi:hypothetical protein